ncbi:MAG TPA: amidohydrolase family protein [Pseudonocardia sp.]|uniref:amidohydrolase family protein n=1 Tax=Pseudonocardia sp. TaxID=60912 RepID=UPI002C270B2C|nr:amidohydrolase family protein [Pseudonocardia sp.]HTF49598.1 amidohydrolase family protein [Pseudonocardia sp.]
MTRRVDAHHHVWDLAVRDQPWTAGLPALRRSFALAELEPELRREGIDATVLVQTVDVPEETPELLALAAKHPVIAGVVGWVDLTAPDVADRIAELVAGPGGRRLVGIRHGVQGEPDPRWLCRDDVRRGLAAVADAGLVYDLLVVPVQLPAAVETVRALPGLRFVLDHAGKPMIAQGERAGWAADIAALGAEDNVAVKLSGLVTEADLDNWSIDDIRPYAEDVLAAFGPERTMYGSDWPVCLLAADYPRVAGLARALIAGLSEVERDAVLGGTAARWYRLDPR